MVGVMVWWRALRVQQACCAGHMCTEAAYLRHGRSPPLSGTQVCALSPGGRPCMHAGSSPRQCPWLTLIAGEPVHGVSKAAVRCKVLSSTVWSG